MPHKGQDAVLALLRAVTTSASSWSTTVSTLSPGGTRDAKPNLEAMVVPAMNTRPRHHATAAKLIQTQFCTPIDTSEEFHALRVPNLGHALAQAGIGWHHLPIEDVSTPTPTWEASWLAVREEVHAALDDGARVLVHCKGGLGRAGLVSACILIERGLAPRAAIAAIRAVRPGAVETPEQERHVLRIARNLVRNA